MTIRTLSAVWLVALSAGLFACDGVGALGEECAAEGATDDCEAGTICGKSDDGDVAECLKQCADQADCPADQECNGVADSGLKACRPKSK